MHRRVVGVLTGLLLVVGVGVALAGLPPGDTFTDDDGNTHEGNIEAIAAQGITLGCNAEGTLYCPKDSVTRAQMATFLVRALDLPPADGNRFADVSGTHLANINALAEAGITLGCNSDGTLFCPDDGVTRAQMASLLARALDLPASETDWFTDDDGLSHESNINAVADAGITLGCGTKIYCPADLVPRDQMASFLARALGLDPIIPPSPTTTTTTTAAPTTTTTQPTTTTTVTTPQRVPRSTPRSEPAPIRTITEGQSTTFAPPVPADRQSIRDCVTSLPGNSKTFFEEGGCYQRSNGDVEYRHYFSSAPSSTTVFGVCSGPYTLEVITRDSRVQTSGNRIRVTTTPSGQDTDDAGTVQVAYLLHGTRTVTFVRFVGLVGQITIFDTASCALTPDPVTVEVRRGTRPGMTAAVAVYAPSTEYLSTPSTVTWECTQVLVDAGVQCALNSVISTTTQPTFPTPRGCRIVVTVSENRPGYGSTNCLTSDEIAAHEDTINNGKPEDEWLDVDSLPPCPLSTAPADLEALDLDSSGRKRCVATN